MTNRQSEVRRSCPALLYHRVGPFRPGAHVELTVSPERFERQIRWLVRRGYSGISPTDWLASARGSKPLPPKPIMLTFDDAYADTAEYALPVLQRNGFSGAVFVVTGRLGGTNTWDEAEGSETLRLMTEEQVRYWAMRGIEFGAHSRTHPHLPKLSEARIADEVMGSKNDLAGLLENPVASFAYPYGEFSAEVLKFVQDGFDLAFTAEEGMNDLQDDPYLLKRAFVGPNESFCEFIFNVRSGRSMRGWRIKLALRTRLRKLFGIRSLYP